MHVYTDESLPSSPQQLQKTPRTILVRNTLLASPELAVTHKPIVTNTTESPTSLELELDTHLDALSVGVGDDELQFDGDKIRMDSDSAIGDVYSNGQCSNSSIITSKETDTSNSSADLKQGHTLPEPFQISVHTDGDDDADADNDAHDEYHNNEHTVPPIEQPDTLSSSPSWNLDGQTPEPEFTAFSVPCALKSTEHSSPTIISSTEHHSDTLDTTPYVDDYHQSDNNNEISQPIGNASISKADDDDSFSKCGEDDACTVKFDADFGQFAAFEDEHFGADAPSSEPPITAATIELSNQCDRVFNAAYGGDGDTAVDDDDDDEFGEFNDFQQMPATPAPETTTVLHKDVAPTANVLLDSENIKVNLSSILDTIFPAAAAGAASADTDYTYEKQQFINNLTVQLRNVENSNALNHQWAKSSSKTQLVKALGIDSRNIVSNPAMNRMRLESFCLV